MRENVGFARVTTEHLEINNSRRYGGRSLFCAPIARYPVSLTTHAATRRASHSRRRFILAFLVVLAWPLWLPLTCPLVMLFVSAEKRAIIALKNRTALPAAADFDPRVTLEAMVAPGADRERWSPHRAAAIEGYVVNVQAAGIELANCFAWRRRDIHIDVARQPNAPGNERVVLEVTPPMREWARRQGLDWSAAALQSLVGKRVRFEGWLMFDWEHDEESENSRPGRAGNWRATAWEVHPITSIAPL